MTRLDPDSLGGPRAGSALRLALACARPPGETRDAAVREAAAAPGLDWAAAPRVLARHRIEGLAQEALSRAGVAPPAGAAAALRAEALAIAALSLGLAHESARLQGLLDDAGLANLVLKGATLDMLAWGRLGLKRAWDIDLLVLPRDAARARRVLEAAGYGMIAPTDLDATAFARWTRLAKEAEFAHGQSGRVVELHWKATDPALLLWGISAASPWQSVTIGKEMALRTLQDGELFAYLSVHGCSHAWSRLKWLADAAALLARRDEAGRESLYRQAMAAGAGHCPAVTLILAEALLGLPMPAACAAEVKANRKALRLARLAWEALAGGEGETEIAARSLLEDRIRLSQVMFADGWAYVWAELRRQAVSLDDRMSFDLPPGLAFLYAVMRAPRWLWRRFRRGGAQDRRGPGGSPPEDPAPPRE